MAENSFVNLFSLLYDAINGRGKDLVVYFENLEGKIVVGNNIQGLFNQISKLSENVYHLVTANDNWTVSCWLSEMSVKTFKIKL